MTYRARLEWSIPSLICCDIYVLGKSTGVVTNTRLTHATPAATYASSVSRAWESDTDVWPFFRDQCPDIARQLVERGHKIKVTH